MHSIFQISISRNTICAEMVDFRKDGHICQLMCAVTDLCVICVWTTMLIVKNTSM